jgi:predicted SAM-dependent methyltransferase
MVEQEEREILSKYAVGTGIDVGCGNYKIGDFGVDIDSSVNPDIVCNMWDVPIPGNTQDYIVSCHCLEHTVYTIKTLKEWHRLLKVGGTLAITVPDGENANPINLGDSEYGHVQLFSMETIKGFLKFVGFEVISSTYFEKESSTKPMGRAMIMVAKKYEKEVEK